MSKERVCVIGAGPAGLAAALELLRRSDRYEVTILEATPYVGGISRTVVRNGYRMDIGPHRFFTKARRVADWWESLLPTQGAPAYDDIVLGRDVELAEGGPDPQRCDRVFLNRNRLSRLLFDLKWFDYPVSPKFETFKNLGFARTIQVGLSYIASSVRRRPEESLEDFYINRFGKKLYLLFFKPYAMKVWGRDPKDIGADWGAQRMKGLSVMAVIRDMLGKAFHKRNRHVETSLIERFKYPKLGAGQMWEAAASEIVERGGCVRFGCRVTGFHKDGNNRLTSVTYERDGQDEVLEADYFISSMPLKEAVLSMNDVPSEPRRIANGLVFRDYITCGVYTKDFAWKNNTDIPTLGGIVPDEWIYLQDDIVKMARFAIFNNWSPYIIDDAEHRFVIGTEYYVDKGDEFWSMSDEEFSAYAIKDLVKIGLLRDASDVLETNVVRVEKAYPAYFDTYAEIDALVDWVKTIPNFLSVGRAGQHRYNNMDHSVMAGLVAADNILAGIEDSSNVWAVNTEKVYHETDETTKESVDTEVEALDGRAKNV